ncbi:MAG: ABC transporter permease, partial [Desulfobacterales bacterium]
MNSVFGLVVKRMGMGILTLFAISIIFFMGVEALPGDLAEEILGQNALPETVAAFRKELKLDLPPHERYFSWLGDLMKGDLGKSLANGRPVVDLVGWRFANTMFLAISAAVIAVPVAILLGIIAALYRNSLFDRAIS